MNDELARLAAHTSIARLLKSLALRQPREIAAAEGTREAAILLVLRAQPSGEPELLMIRRAEFEGDPWSGHIACPGGRRERGDSDLRHTAVRETLEETGVDVERDGRVIGQLDDLRPFTPKLPPIVIRPFLALVKAHVDIVPSSEVADAFWISLAALAAPAAWGIGTVQADGNERRVRAFQHGDHTIWGLTERVLDQFLEYSR